MRQRTTEFARFVASHGCAVVATTDTTLTTCTVWTSAAHRGWRIETHEANYQRVREWLGY